MILLVHNFQPVQNATGAQQKKKILMSGAQNLNIPYIQHPEQQKEKACFSDGHPKLRMKWHTVASIMG